MKTVLILFVLFFSALPAQSYVPRTQTIVKKMTANNGRREYKIVREVSIESKERQVKAREVWTVANGDKMKVEVTSLDPNNSWQFTIFYGPNNRKTLNASQKVKSFKKSPDFFEPLFHDRYHRSLTKRLIHYRFVPDWVPETPAPTVNNSKTVMTPEPFISLEPMEGSISYAIGSKKTRAGGKSHTQLWVEQDSFIIRKGRLTSGAEFVNVNYQSYPGRLKLPSEQRIGWDNKIAKVKVLAVERTKTKGSDWKLAGKSDRGIPSDPLIKEFYSRFR